VQPASEKTPTLTATTKPEDGIALCTFKTARVTAEPTTMPIRHADTTKIATRFAFNCSILFDLKDNSDYEKTVDKQSREKITPKKSVQSFCQNADNTALVQIRAYEFKN
jgi:hypothetical protein